KFAMLILRSGRTVGPFLESDAPNHGLTPLPPTESNIDGLSFPNGTRQPVYYTVARGGTRGPADIYYVAQPGVTPPVLYASATQLGLMAGDNIDGLDNCYGTAMTATAEPVLLRIHDSADRPRPMVLPRTSAIRRSKIVRSTDTRATQRGGNSPANGVA